MTATVTYHDLPPETAEHRRRARALCSAAEAVRDRLTGDYERLYNLALDEGETPADRLDPRDLRRLVDAVRLAEAEVALGAGPKTTVLLALGDPRYDRGRDPAEVRARLGALAAIMRHAELWRAIEKLAARLLDAGTLTVSEIARAAADAHTRTLNT